MFRDRKAQNWNYVAHLRGVAVVMNIWRAKEVRLGLIRLEGLCVAGSETAGASWVCKRQVTSDCLIHLRTEFQNRGCVS